MPPKVNPIIHSIFPLRFIVYAIAIIFIMVLGYIIFDGIFRIRRLRKSEKSSKLNFKDYKEILNSPLKYRFHAPYGIENALIAFNSETPYILDVIETCIERNRHLMQRYKNNEDPKVLSYYLDIEIKLTSMIANSGINLMHRCKFFCQNCSKTFQLPCDSELVRQYIENAERLHEQFEILKNEEFKTPEVLKISRTMYYEFFNFFETINSLLSINENISYTKEEDTK